METARRDTTIALQDAAAARREADLARREAETARREIRALRLEAALDLEVRESLAEQVLTLRAARDGAPAIDVPRPNLALPHSQVETNSALGSLAASSQAIGSRRDITIPTPPSRLSIPLEEVNISRTIEGDCSICLDILGNDGIVRCEGRCQQRFHGNCMNAWLRERRECPLW